MSQSQRAKHPVFIIGAGIAGLTCGRCLRRQGISATILEKSPDIRKRHGYSIRLSNSTYRRLKDLSGIDSNVFDKTTLIRHESPNQLNDPPIFAEGTQRVHRSRLENLLAQGLDIRYGNTVEKVSIEPEGISIHIEGKSPIEASTAVAVDGVHSPTRKSLAPDTELDILPYVVFYGTRRVSLEAFENAYSAAFKDSMTIQNLTGDGILLRLFVNDYASEHVDLGYTYSRAAAQSSNPLHNPTRSNAAAKDVPEAFYHELASLSRLPPAFWEVFAPENVRQDRVLHWLMRSALPDQSRLRELAGHGILLLGDAVHPAPILGSSGAEIAIADAFDLSDWMKDHSTGDLEEFVDSRYCQWAAAVRSGVKMLGDMHMATNAIL